MFDVVTPRTICKEISGITTPIATLAWEAFYFNQSLQHES
jgi:hypothetical protein